MIRCSTLTCSSKYCPTSEAYDRGKKFEQYRTLASLTDYLLIAQDKALVEHYSRQTGERWLLVAVNNLTENVHITSIGCSLALAEVYLNVDGIANPR